MPIMNGNYNYLKQHQGKNLMIITEKNIVFGGDFNLIFDCKFDASGGNPILKKNLQRNLLR